MARFPSLIPLGRGSLIRRGYHPLFGFGDEMDRMLQDLEHGMPPASAQRNDGFLIPKVDVAETDAGLELTAELPGFEEKDVSLDIHDGVLTIKAEHKEEREEKDEKKHYHLLERSQGTFLRRLALPFEADVDKASAHLEHGLLKVTVPRLATAEKKPKTIPVGTSKVAAGQKTDNPDMIIKGAKQKAKSNAPKAADAVKGLPGDKI